MELNNIKTVNELAIKVMNHVETHLDQPFWLFDIHYDDLRKIEGIDAAFVTSDFDDKLSHSITILTHDNVEIFWSNDDSRQMKCLYIRRR